MSALVGVYSLFQVYIAKFRKVQRTLPRFLPTART